MEGRGRPLAVELGSSAGDALGGECAELGRAALTLVAVHGVARPGRAHEIESFFMLGYKGPALPSIRELLHHFEHLMPHLHATCLRTQSLERVLRPADRAASQEGVDRANGLLSKREREIIEWVRDGKTNQQIADVLGISALTVKNHVQSILRKLGESNRAQALATAMEAQLLGRDANPGDVLPMFDSGSDGRRRP